VTATPAPPAAGPARRPPLVALVDYTLRTCLPGRRWLGLAALFLAALVFGALVHALEGDPADEFARVAAEALFGLVMPVTCLIIGDAVLGSEVRSGALAFTWMTPVPASLIVLGRWIGGTVIAAGCLMAAFAAAAVLAGAAESAGPAAVAAGFGAMAYVAVFVAIGAIAQRAAVWSLAVVFLVERLLGAALAGIAQLSPTWEARAAFVDLSDGPRSLVRSGIPQGVGALVRLVLITVAALAIATWRLRRLQISGSSD
jgi:ABC-type transport system involved in multi-copper enzyme maturation permease subunit